MKTFTLILLWAAIASSALAKYTGPTNAAGLDLIKEFEGFRSKFYYDLKPKQSYLECPRKSSTSNGICTIGYGHACHVNNCAVPLNGKYRVPLSLADGERLLRDDLEKGNYEKCVKQAVTLQTLNANQFSALVSFTFNLGCNNLQKSDLLRLLNNGDIPGASREFGRFIYAKGQVLRGLVRRRDAERELFCRSGGCSGSNISGNGGRSNVAGGSCTGRINANGGLNIRSVASTSGRIVGSLANGALTTIKNRVLGTSVGGNRYWFHVGNGYVSAYYVTITSNSGKAWCSKY